MSKEMFLMNEEGKIISKEVDENLISLYKNLGWTLIKPKSNLEKEEKEDLSKKSYEKK